MLLFCKFRINDCSDLSYGIGCECGKEHRNLNFIVLLHRVFSAFVYVAKEVEVVVVVMVVVVVVVVVAVAVATAVIIL
jgi:hypothetical protein